MISQVEDGCSEQHECDGSGLGSISVRGASYSSAQGCDFPLTCLLDSRMESNALLTAECQDLAGACALLLLEVDRLGVQIKAADMDAWINADHQGSKVRPEQRRQVWCRRGVGRELGLGLGPS